MRKQIGKVASGSEGAPDLGSHVKSRSAALRKVPLCCAAWAGGGGGRRPSPPHPHPPGRRDCGSDRSGFKKNAAFIHDEFMLLFFTEKFSFCFLPFPFLNQLEE